MIADQHEQILIERRRAAVPPVDVERGDLLAEVALPHQLAVHVERDDLAGTEPCVDELPVRHRAWRGEVVLVVHRWERAGGLEAILPEPAPRCAVERLDQEEGPVRGRRARRAQRPFARARRVGALRQSRTLTADARADLRGDENTSAGHDRRRHADTAQIGLPRDVLGGGPAEREIFLVRDAVAVRAAPLRPVGGGDGPAESHRHHQAESKGARHRGVLSQSKLSGKYKVRLAIRNWELRIRNSQADPKCELPGDSAGVGHEFIIANS
jgi:hypothetical protein